VVATTTLQAHIRIVSRVCGVAIADLLGAMLSAATLALGLAVSRRLENPVMVSGVGRDGGADAVSCARRQLIWRRRRSDVRT
jgi:hypothetical protein